MNYRIFIQLCMVTIILVSCGDNSGYNSSLQQNVADHDESHELILAENKDKSIVVTGVEQKEKGLIGPITVRHHGVSKTFEWENEAYPSFYPELVVEDLDSDGEDEIVVFLTKGHGTEVRDLEAHLLSSTLEEIVWPDSVGIAKEHVSYEATANNSARLYTIKDPVDTYRFQFKESDADLWFDDVVIGNSISYRVEDNLILALLSVQVSPGIVVGNLEVTYELLTKQLTKHLVQQKVAFAVHDDYAAHVDLGSREQEVQYIDESAYDGIELELIKLLNLTLKYRNSGDEESYLSLFTSDLNHTPPPRKIVGLEIEFVDIASEILATASVREIHDWSGDSMGALYIFSKENDEWKISGTD